ncbi:MAG: molecular chaperone TorD family protein [Bacteroidetes bacterium]|nr:molecular chaperone TorD family protein [Bacteroidota bacterium]
MGMPRDVLDALARTLHYPGEDYRSAVTRCRELCACLGSGGNGGARAIAEAMTRFAEGIDGLTAGELEELYTRTFDINPVSSLEVGWHLYGETYERGAFLVRMRELLRRCSVEESTELPDHLTHLLLALGRIDGEEAGSFVAGHLLRAVDKMCEGFAGKDNPYAHVLAATRVALLEICAQMSTLETTS